MRLRAAALGVLLLTAAHAFAVEPCRSFRLTTLSFTLSDTRYYADTRTECLNERDARFAGAFQARSYVVDETTAIIVGEDVCKTCSSLDGQEVWVGAVGGVPDVGHCYRSRVAAASSYASQGIGTARQCTTGGAAPAICDTRPWRCDPRYFEECPLLIQTGQGRWDLTSTEDGVLFDLDGDGKQERTAWTRAGSDLAFLALDVDGSGAIEDSRELFGPRMFPPDAEVSNGFEVLARFDIDGNGTVDARDPVWPSLLLWKDVDHDGRSSAGELQPLATSDINAISIDYSEAQRRDRFGNAFRYRALVHRASGSTEPYYDVFFQARPEP